MDIPFAFRRKIEHATGNVREQLSAVRYREATQEPDHKLCRQG